MLTLALSIIFIVTYVVMAKGYLPNTKLARAEVAVIAGILVLLLGVVPIKSLPEVIQYRTIIILVVLMLISAQFHHTYFYDWCATKIAAYSGSSARLLLLIIVTSGVLSALLANDVIAFAMTPILCRGLLKRKLNPKPYLIALMAACNVGSAATIIGNPQNLLIAGFGHLSFWGFFKLCALPALFGMLFVFAVVWLMYRKEFLQPARDQEFYFPEVERKQTLVGFMALVVLIGLFFTSLAHYQAALIVGLVFLAIRWRYARSLFSMVDWRLILLFIGLFIVNKGFALTGLPIHAVNWLIAHGVDLQQLWVLAPYALVGSNTIGNVPAVILTLTMWPPQSAQTLTSLALLTTFAGNTFIYSSLANIIVAERAQLNGVKIYFFEHAKVGLFITLITMLMAVWWLA